MGMAAYVCWILRRKSMSIERYIKWKPEYDILVGIINSQHKGILDFLNIWYSEISAETKLSNGVIEYMNTKYRFLARFSIGHIGFEEVVLKLLRSNYGFPQESFKLHISKHHDFINKDLKSLYQYFKSLSVGSSVELLTDIPGNTVSDIAKWWYNHIRAPFSSENHVPPDHEYRMFINEMDAERKISFLNDIIMYLGTNAKSKLAMIEAMDYFRDIA
jgi:hemerythrin